MLSDIRRGLGASVPSEFTVLGDQLFFAADDGTHGRELWAVPFSCPEQSDTRCLGLEVAGPAANAPGVYQVTATAADDSGDTITYIFEARKDTGAPVVVGPQEGNAASFELDLGTWTISVVVDDDPYCSDTAADAICSTTFEVKEPGGLVIPGDANGDGTLDLSDPVAVLGILFLGSTTPLSCGNGDPLDPGNVSLLDWQPDGDVDLSDAVASLSFLFVGGGPHCLAVPGAEAEGCVRILDCPDRCEE